nr:hypothetical protein [Pseudomonadota bacterium]
MQQLGEEQIFFECRNQAQQGQECYEKALSLVATHPAHAIKLFYQAYLTSSHYLTRLRLLNLPADITESNPPENLNLAGTLEEIFFRGLQILNGLGVNRSYQSASAYFDYVIEVGIANNDMLFVPHAQLWKGMLYKFGRGVPHDEAIAAQWYRKAAEQRFAKAERNLGVCFELG